jgi:hypothetical protein
MWYGRRIYFLSDRGAGFRANIWAYYLDARTFTQITHFSDFDVDTLLLGAATITFQPGGGLYAVDLPSETLREIKVRVPDDRLRTAARKRSAARRGRPMRWEASTTPCRRTAARCCSPCAVTFSVSRRTAPRTTSPAPRAWTRIIRPGVRMAGWQDEYLPGIGRHVRPPPARHDTGLLGTDYVLEAPSGRYRLSHILSGDNARADFRSPLIAPGFGLHDGDFILAVNGHELRAPTDPDEQLVGLTHELTITVAASADGPRRDVRVEPLENEGPLRRFEWVEQNRARVDRLSQGRIRYVALSDFAMIGWREFVRQFYPQAGKEGLVFDVRWNRGGFTSQAVLDVLRRPLEQDAFSLNRLFKLKA